MSDTELLWLCRRFLQELADLSDDSINDADPALFGSFRDEAKELLVRLNRRTEAR
jgi:hypothetical protein